MKTAQSTELLTLGPSTLAYAVTNSIQVHGTIQGLEFWVWLFPGDPPPSSVQVTISQPSSVRPGHSRVLFDGIVSLTQGGCFTNIFDQQVCQESARFDGPTLNGIAWLTLQNAIIPSGNPVYWDQNSGVGCQSPGCPSRAYENTVGTIPSETFTIFGR